MHPGLLLNSLQGLHLLGQADTPCQQLTLTGRRDSERARERERERKRDRESTLRGVSYTFSSSRKYKSNYLVTVLRAQDRVCRGVFFDFTCLRRLFHHSCAGFQPPHLSAEGGQSIWAEEGEWTREKPGESVLVLTSALSSIISESAVIMYTWDWCYFSELNAMQSLVGDVNR